MVLKRDRALDDLRINPVKVIGAPTDKIPSTTKLRGIGKNKGLYKSALKLAAEIAGSNIHPSQLNRNNISGKYPSASFYTWVNDQGPLVYEVEKEDEARVHLERRMRELGII